MVGFFFPEKVCVELGIVKEAGNVWEMGTVERLRKTCGCEWFFVTKYIFVFGMNVCS